MSEPIEINDLTDLGHLTPGQEVVMPVRPNDRAASFAAENAIIVTAGSATRPDHVIRDIEIIFVSSTSRLIGQSGSVKDVGDGTAQLQLSGFKIVPEIVESGRVRMNIDSAVDMAMGVLQHALATSLIDPSVLLERLEERGIVASDEE